MRAHILFFLLILGCHVAVACKTRTTPDQSAMRSIMTIEDRAQEVTIKNGKRTLNLEYRNQEGAKQIYDAIQKTDDNGVYETEQDGRKWRMFQTTSGVSTEKFRIACAVSTQTSEYLCQLYSTKLNTNAAEQPMIIVEDKLDSFVISTNPKSDSSLAADIHNIFGSVPEVRLPKLPADKKNLDLISTSKIFSATIKKGAVKTESRADNVVEGESPTAFGFSISNSTQICGLVERMSEKPFDNYKVYTDASGFLNKELYIKGDVSGKHQELWFYCWKNVSGDKTCGCGLDLKDRITDRKALFIGQKSKSQPSSGEIFLARNDSDFDTIMRPFFDVFSAWPTTKVQAGTDPDTGISSPAGLQFDTGTDSNLLRVACRKNEGNDHGVQCKVLVTIPDSDDEE